MINLRHAFFVLLLLGQFPAQALQINSNNSTYSRFSGGYPGSPTNNSGFFAADYDLSGVGWNNASSGQSFAVISPDHAVGAWHFLPGVGSTIRFFNEDGFFVNRMVSAQTQIAGTDLALLTFSTSLTEADQVKINPVLVMPVLGDYVGQRAWMYGQTAKLSSANEVNAFQMISNISGPTLMSIYFRDYTTPGQAVGQGGDSGSPTFVPWDGMLGLIGTHSGIALNVEVSPGVTNDLTVDAFIPAYISNLNTAMGGTYRVSTINVLPSGNFNSPGGTEFQDSVALYITNGALLLNNSAGTSGAGLFITNDRKAVVTGAGSLWSNLPTLIVGDAHRSNSLHILEGARVTATNLIVGATAASTNNLVQIAGAGSRLIVTNATGTGTLDVRRGNLNLQGGEVRADTILATNAQALISGFGSLYGETTISGGAYISPGNSPGTLDTFGTMTWGADGGYLWEINDFAGAPGVNWDFVNVSGLLDITTTDMNPFTIDISSLGGLAAGFDQEASYQFNLVTASLGISGFAADKFFLDTTAFANPFTHTWSINLTGNNLVLSYNAIPEPATGTLLVVAVGVILFFRCRRLKKFLFRT